MSQQLETVPNMGRDGLLKPPSIDHIYRYLPKDLPVEIKVLKGSDQTPILPKDRHWAITWRVGETKSDPKIPVRRTLHIVRERGREGPLEYLTNWGPLTKTDDLQTQNEADFYKVAVLSYNQRQGLEAIATSQPVLVPNGWWNCQHWIRDVLMRSVHAGICSEDDVRAAIKEIGWCHEEF